MANTTRRDVMRTFLAMPAAAAVASSFICSAEAQPPTTSIPFNVVVHGGAVIEFDAQTMRVKVQLPGINGHCYLAGSWGTESPLDAGKNFSFGNTIVGADQLPSVLKKGTTADFPIIRRRLAAGKVPRNFFDLPFPTDIVSAYSAKCLSQRPFFKDGSALEFQPKILPLVLVLQYSIPATVAPKLAALPWSAQINFHIFAELPNDKIPHGHGADLLTAEQDLYSGLSGDRITFSDDVGQHKCEYSASVVPPPGISTWETASLGRRKFPKCPSPSSAGGGHPASCMALIVIM